MSVSGQLFDPGKMSETDIFVGVYLPALHYRYNPICGHIIVPCRHNSNIRIPSIPLTLIHILHIPWYREHNGISPCQTTPQSTAVYRRRAAIPGLTQQREMSIQLDIIIHIPRCCDIIVHACVLVRGNYWTSFVILYTGGCDCLLTWECLSPLFSPRINT